MKISHKPFYFLSGVLVGLWSAVLFIRMDFNSTVGGLTEAGNANWENLSVEMVDTIGLLIFGLLIISVIYLAILGIFTFITTKK